MVTAYTALIVLTPPTITGFKGIKTVLNGGRRICGGQQDFVCSAREARLIYYSALEGASRANTPGAAPGGERAVQLTVSKEGE